MAPVLSTTMIGNRIAEARKKLNISQARLAESLFVSPQAVGKWERGESMPDIITFNRLAEVLGVDLNYFSQGFRSVTPGTTPAGDKERSSDELPSGDGDKISWNMSLGNWVDADFSGLKNLHEKFSTSNLQRCLFIGADLSGIQLKNNNVEACDFTGSDLSGSRIHISSLTRNHFNDCSLRKTEISGSSIKGCDFSGADFSGMTFKYTDFVRNIITAAVWNRTSFTASTLADITFDGSMEECKFVNCTFTRVTFSNSTLINTFFKNNSLKRIRFIDCKADRMTYAFLKTGKADMTGITLMTT